MNKLKFVNISDLVEDGYLNVDDPKEENELLKAILYCYLESLAGGDMLILDRNVRDMFENPDPNVEMKMEKVEFEAVSKSIGGATGIRIWLDDSYYSDDYNC